MEDTEAENLRLRISAMDLSSEASPIEQELTTIREERDVFYDDEGLALDDINLFKSVVVVDNLPTAGHDGARELETDLREIFGGVGAVKRDGFSMPVNPRTLETLGYCFVEFTTRQEAEQAVENIDGYKYGGSKLSVTFYDDCHKPEQATPEFEPDLSEKREDNGLASSETEEEKWDSEISDLEDEIGKAKHLVEIENAKQCQWQE